MGGIHLDDFHDAVVASLESIGWLNSVEAYPEHQTELVGPCAFFSVIDWEFAEEQPMNGQIAVDLSCELLVVFGRDDSGYQKSIRNAAMAICAKVHGNRWGLQVEPAVLKGASPDGFTPELDAYAVWRIEWQQRAEIGIDQYHDDGSGFVPTTIMVSQSPHIGAGNEGHYEPTS